MKLVDLFNDFMKDVVNLNQTRVDDLETSIDAIKSARDIVEETMAEFHRIMRSLAQQYVA